MSELNLKLASNYINLKERFDNFLVREVVKPKRTSLYK